MKTNLYLIVLSIFAIALLSSCQKEELDNLELLAQTEVVKNEIADAGDLQLDRPIILKAKKRKGRSDATFELDFYGDWKPDGKSTFTAEAIPGPREVISVRREVIQLKLVNILLGVDRSSNCLGTIMGIPSNETAFSSHTPLQINQEQDGNRAKVGFWFRGMDKFGTETADYLLYMSGPFVGQWPPAIDSPTTIDFKDFELNRSKKDKSACEGIGELPSGIQIELTRNPDPE